MGKDMVGNVESCVRCGNVYLYTGVGKHICKECKDEEDEQFNLVKDYIYNNPLSTVMEVASATNVRVARIKMFLKEGRLLIPDNSPIFLNCEICGTNIKYGRICRPCADNLNNNLKSDMQVSEYEIGEKPDLAKRRFMNHYNE